MRVALLILAGGLMLSSESLAMSDGSSPADRAAAVRGAVEGFEADLGRMPFFVRPFARRGFTERTGRSTDDWRELLGGVRADDSPAKVRARWPTVEADLTRLLEEFRTAPERARKGMGDRPELMTEVTEKSRARADAVQALLDWLRR